MQTPDAHKPIKNAADYEAAMELIENLWDAKPGTPEADQLEALAIHVEQYESQQFPIACT